MATDFFYPLGCKLRSIFFALAMGRMNAIKSLTTRVLKPRSLVSAGNIVATSRVSYLSTTERVSGSGKSMAIAGSN